MEAFPSSGLTMCERDPWCRHGGNGKHGKKNGDPGGGGGVGKTFRWGFKARLEWDCMDERHRIEAGVVPAGHCQQHAFFEQFGYRIRRTNNYDEPRKCCARTRTNAKNIEKAIEIC